MKHSIAVSLLIFLLLGISIYPSEPVQADQETGNNLRLVDHTYLSIPKETGAWADVTFDPTYNSYTVRYGVNPEGSESPILNDLLNYYELNSSLTVPELSGSTSIKVYLEPNPNDPERPNLKIAYIKDGNLYVLDMKTMVDGGEEILVVDGQPRLAAQGIGDVKLANFSRGYWPGSNGVGDPNFRRIFYLNSETGKVDFVCQGADWNSWSSAEGFNEVPPSTQTVVADDDKATHVASIGENGALNYSRITGFEPGNTENSVVNDENCSDPAMVIGPDGLTALIAYHEDHNAMNDVFAVAVISFFDAGDPIPPQQRYSSSSDIDPAAAIGLYELADDVAVSAIGITGGGATYVFFVKNGSIWAQEINSSTGPVGQAAEVVSGVNPSRLIVGGASALGAAIAYYDDQSGEVKKFLYPIPGPYQENSSSIGSGFELLQR